MANIRKSSADDNHLEIWDRLRRRWLRHTPEEGVRQWLIDHLEASGYRLTSMASEVTLRFGSRRLRADLVVYGLDGTPLMICECKAPHISVDNSTFIQAAQYNMELRVPYLLVTNGNLLYCAHIDLQGGNFTFLEKLPQI